MLKIKIVAIATLVTILSTPGMIWAKNNQKTPSKAQDLDKIVAVVNDDVITQSELEKSAHIVTKRLEEAHQQIPDKKTLDKQILNQIIDKKLQLQVAHRAGIEVDDNTLDEAIDNIAKRNKLSRAKLREMVESDGMSFKDFSEDVREQITIERVISQQVASRISIDNHEVENYMNSALYDQQNIKEYHVKDILISLPEVPSTDDLQQAKQTASEILAELKNGKKFSTLAQEKSHGENALTGGDLGWRRIEEIPSVFAKDIQIMKSGEVKGPIRTSNGLHIIKLVDARGNVHKHSITESQARHILIKTTLIKGDEETRAQLLNIKQQIKNGASFEELAEKYSEDPGSAIHGGALGWVKPGQLVAPFEKAMNALAIDEISEPVKSQYGWHIIQVLARRDKDNTENFEKEQVKKLIYQRHYEEEIQAWIKRMRDASYVQVVSSS